MLVLKLEECVILNRVSRCCSKLSEVVRISSTMVEEGTYVSESVVAKGMARFTPVKTADIFFSRELSSNS